MTKEERDMLAAEAIIRRMRNTVYEVPTSDRNWNMCKENWMKPENVQWLNDRVQRIKDLTPF